MKTAAEAKKLNVFTVIRRLFPMVITATPVLVIVSLLLSILHGASWGGIAYFTQGFFDNATLFAEKKVELSAVLLALCGLGGIHLVCQILNGVGNFIPQVCVDKAVGKLQIKVHSKMSRLAAVSFENTEILDDINKAEQGKNNAVWFLMQFSSIFTFYTVYFSCMAFYLFGLSPVLALSILIIFIPTATTQLLRSKVFSKLEDQSAPVRREYEYYESCITEREYFKETRLLGAFGFFKKLYLDSLRLLNEIRFKANVKTNLFELAMKIVTMFGYACILYMLFQTLMRGKISVGAFAAVFASLGMLYSIMEEVVCRHVGAMSQNFGTIQNYLRFLDLPERTGEETNLPDNADIALKNVSFAYPGAEGKAIDDVSFTIRNGETIAIVGENGSGKSTLIRLISGLYLPQSGDVKYGDVSIRNIAPARLFGRMSAVFQKYQRYQMTLRDNITISQTGRNSSEEELDGIGELSGLSKEEACFPDAYDTMLSREFDGVDLSGGQWQRISIARGFYRVHNLIILDEPTAAIDPLEETKIYNRFAKIARDKTAVIVTHRLGSVRLADRILVLEKGRLCESGTHDELMRCNGVYAGLYASQEQWYK